MLKKYISSKQTKDYALCLGNVSKYFTINNIKKTGLKGVVKFLSVDFNSVDTNDILDFLMKRFFNEKNII